MRLLLDTHALLWAISDEQRPRRFRGHQAQRSSSTPVVMVQSLVG